MVFQKNVQGDDVLHLVMVVDCSVGVVRSALINAVNFTVYESLRKEISQWEKEESIGQWSMSLSNNELYHGCTIVIDDRLGIAFTSNKLLQFFCMY